MLRLWRVCVVCGTQRDKSLHSEKKLTVKPSPSYIHSLDCGRWDTQRERIHMLRLWSVCVVCGTQREKGVVVDRFYVALFSALKQAHCACVWFYLSKQLFIVCFWIFTEVVCLQCWRGWCHVKLLPSRHVLCTPYNHAPCQMQSHICKVCVFSRNLPPTLLAEWLGSFVCNCGNTGVEWIPV